MWPPRRCPYAPISHTRMVQNSPSQQSDLIPQNGLTVQNSLIQQSGLIPQNGLMVQNSLMVRKPRAGKPTTVQKSNVGLSELALETASFLEKEYRRRSE